VPCGLIINELAANALKHGYPGSRGGRVLIEMQPEGGLMRLRVSDDGAGLPADLDLGQPPTLGLRLVQDLTRQLHGQFRADRRADPPGGTEITIVFPWKTPEGQGGPV
jgi:two-component sensor histidine kinase